MRLVILTAIGVALAAPAVAQKPAIDAALVAKIEQQMVMPKGASPLKSYSRFYAPGQVSGRDMIKGVYLEWREDHYLKNSTPIEGVPGAYVMKPGADLPMIMDGGCGVIETAFDVATQKPVVYQITGDREANPNATAMCHGRG